MKHLAALLTLACAPAFATTAPAGAVEKMVAQSEFYMSCDLCQVANQRLTAPGSFAQFYVAGVGLVKVPAAEYNVIQSAGKQVGNSGLFLMSETVQNYCSTDWDGGVCRGARFLWKQEWPTGQCVKPNGGVYTARQK